MITTWWLKYAVLAAAIFALCYLSYDYGATSVQSAWNDERAKLNEATAKALSDINTQRNESEKALQAKELENWSKYNEADELAKKLNDDLTNRPWRVRIESANCGMPETDPTASVGDGEEYQAQLPIEATRDLITIGSDADKCEAKLSALQEWANIILK